jgi:hypothetical protein
MNNTNRERAEQLGMPYGTAANKLRKMLMFKFAKELGYDTCFKCSKLIESVEELSIEHKEPWFKQEDGTEKFWNLDNIAFSHRACNRPHTNGNAKYRKVGPDGTAWCGFHKEFHPKENFEKDSHRWNGLKGYCKERKKILNRRRYGRVE